jgi:hypothetical protein
VNRLCTEARARASPRQNSPYLNSHGPWSIHSRTHGSHPATLPISALRSEQVQPAAWSCTPSPDRRLSTCPWRCLPPSAPDRARRTLAHPCAAGISTGPAACLQSARRTALAPQATAARLPQGSSSNSAPNASRRNPRLLPRIRAGGSVTAAEPTRSRARVLHSLFIRKGLFFPSGSQRFSTGDNDGRE